MKKANLLTGFTSGLVFGIVLAFLFLIGFIETGAGLLSKLFGDPVATNTLPKLGYVILFLALMAIWSGSNTAKYGLVESRSMATLRGTWPAAGSSFSISAKGSPTTARASRSFRAGTIRRHPAPNRPAR